MIYCGMVSVKYLWSQTELAGMPQIGEQTTHLYCLLRDNEKSWGKKQKSYQGSSGENWTWRKGPGEFWNRLYRSSAGHDWEPQRLGSDVPGERISWRALPFPSHLLPLSALNREKMGVDNVLVYSILHWGSFFFAFDLWMTENCLIVKRFSENRTSILPNNARMGSRQTVSALFPLPLRC